MNKKLLLSDLTLVKNDDIKKYLKFYKYIKDNMEHPEWLGDFTEEEIINILNNNGVIFNYYDNDEIACSVFYIPSNNKTLRKHNIDLDEKLVGSCGPIMVNPKYRGNNLQQQMLQRLEEHSKNNKEKYIFTKVVKENIYSINNFIKEGYEYIETYKSKDGQYRNVYLKKID